MIEQLVSTEKLPFLGIANLGEVSIFYRPYGSEFMAVLANDYEAFHAAMIKNWT